MIGDNTLIGLRREIQICGIYIAPFVGYVFAATVLYLLLRPILRLLGFERIFANPPLAEAAIFTCLLGLLVVFL